DFVPYRRPDTLAAGVGVDRTLADVGAMARLGRPGRLAILGLSATMERTRSSALPVALGSEGELPDSTPALVNRFESYRSARVNLLLGFRAVRFMRVASFDALSAEQDVRKGVQLGAAIGRGFPLAEGWDDDVYSSGGLYVGGGGPRSFGGLEVGAEARRATDDEHWSAIYTGGRGAVYLRPHERHTLTTSVEWSGAYRPRLPVQLSLADRRNGVHGYAKSYEGGARRLVFRSEERWRFGNVRRTAHVGVTAFLETGRLWLGDAALGADTPWRWGLGTGLVVAVPPRSQRLWRAEIAIPLTSGAGGRFEVRLSSADRTPRWWVEPNDLRRSGRRTPLGDLFSWP
ncbi:MAG TPA: hypothetical protein VJ717_12980, partial [Gemmatimonadaceae bacterium]|nr:hypothetical protein [Gemmatimonadaceae bacterium]